MQLVLLTSGEASYINAGPSGPHYCRLFESSLKFTSSLHRFTKFYPNLDAGRLRKAVIFYTRQNVYFYSLTSNTLYNLEMTTFPQSYLRLCQLSQSPVLKHFFSTFFISSIVISFADYAHLTPKLTRTKLS